MIRPALTALFLSILPATSHAGQFDGLYAPTGMQWSCNHAEIGMDGGAFRIERDNLNGVENHCRLSQPTAIRDMDAVLYDATCASEGSEYSFRLMLLRKPGGVYVISDGAVADWSLCP